MVCPNREVPQSVFNTQSTVIDDFLNGRTTVRPTSCLHEHQIEAVLAAKRQLQDRDAPNIALVVLPTGCGKTGVAVLAAYALNASRVLVITPSVKISGQIHEAFCGSQERHCFLVERGIVQTQDQNMFRPYGSCITQTDKILEHTTDPFMVVNAHKIGGQSSVQIDQIQKNNYDLVIVDEAHHYPAPTWHLLVDHFANSRRLFLTATPEHGGKPILAHNPCFTLDRGIAVQRGIIRPVDFSEVHVPWPGDMQAIARSVRHFLDQHDKEDRHTRHQAMVLTQTIQGLNPANEFKAAYDAVTIQGDVCEKFVGQTSNDTLKRFNRGEIRTLIIVGRLTEGYDNKRISVAAIVRNVARQSKVLFSQFVGRAVRKACLDDPVTAMVVSHEKFNQRINFQQFDKVTEEENDESEEN